VLIRSNLWLAFWLKPGIEHSRNENGDDKVSNVADVAPEARTRPTDPQKSFRPNNGIDDHRRDKKGQHFYRLDPVSAISKWRDPASWRHGSLRRLTVELSGARADA